MLTNKFNLPEPIYRAAVANHYSKGAADYSVTELLLPPRLGALRRFHAAKLVEDVADCIDSLEGQMWHLLFYQAGAPSTGAILEERLYATFNGMTISGAMDHTLLTEGQLDDYKNCSVYAVKACLQEPKWEWVWQLNIYRLLRAIHGQQIDSLRIIARMRDWLLPRAIAAAETEGDYPQHPIAVIPIPIHPLAEVEAFVKERIELHRNADRWIEAQAAPEPFCTDEERWRSPVEYALMVPGRKNAVKLFKGPTAQADAEAALLQTENGRLEQRGGIYRRCRFYCPAGRAGLCTQWENTKLSQPALSSTCVDTSAFE